MPISDTSCKLTPARSLSLLLLLSLGILSCTRPEAKPGHSHLKIGSPSEISLRKALNASSISLGSNIKYCFAVHVSGSGIAGTSPNSCSPALGRSLGFFEAGKSVTIENIPKGNGRTIELFLYLGQTEESCPTISNAFSTAEERYKVHKVASLTNINLSKDEETLELVWTNPDLKSPLASQASGVCIPSVSLRGVLLNNGDIVEASAKTMELSSALNESVFTSTLSSWRSKGILTADNRMLAQTQTTELPPWLHSLTIKPDLGFFYALDHSGKIYHIDFDKSGAVLATTSLTSTNCPFAVSNCQVPIWIQSISAGFADQLYGLDHSGNVYRLSADSAAWLSLNVGQSARQVSFH